MIKLKVINKNGNSYCLEHSKNMYNLTIYLYNSNETFEIGDNFIIFEELLNTNYTSYTNVFYYQQLEKNKDLNDDNLGKDFAIVEKDNDKKIYLERLYG